MFMVSHSIFAQARITKIDKILVTGKGHCWVITIKAPEPVDSVSLEANVYGYGLIQRCALCNVKLKAGNNVFTLDPFFAVGIFNHKPVSYKWNLKFGSDKKCICESEN